MGARKLKVIEVPVVRVVMQTQPMGSFSLEGIEWPWPNPSKILRKPLYALARAEDALDVAQVRRDVLVGDPDKAELELRRSNDDFEFDGYDEEFALPTVEEFIMKAHGDVEYAEADLVRARDAAHLVLSHNTVSVEVPLPMAHSHAHIDQDAYNDVKPDLDNLPGVDSVEVALLSNAKTIADVAKVHAFNNAARHEFGEYCEHLTFYMDGLTFLQLPFMTQDGEE